jgi:hypothetical protein
VAAYERPSGVTSSRSDHLLRSGPASDRRTPLSLPGIGEHTARDARQVEFSDDGIAALLAAEGGAASGGERRGALTRLQRRVSVA